MPLDLPNPPTAEAAQDEFERRMSDAFSRLQDAAMQYYSNEVADWEDRGPASIDALNEIVDELIQTCAKLAALTGAYELATGDENGQYSKRSSQGFYAVMEPLLQMLVSFELSEAWRLEMEVKGIDMDAVRDELVSMSDEEWDDLAGQ